MLLVSQRDVDKYGSQPVGITLYFYVVGFRVKKSKVAHHWLLPEVGKVTLKINADEALSN
jgi:hypothetical protein